MEMDEKSKNARTELAREVVGAGGLTVELADTLIGQVYVYPNKQVEIVWKMKDFCMGVRIINLKLLVVYAKLVTQ